MHTPTSTSVRPPVTPSLTAGRPLSSKKLLGTERTTECLHFPQKKKKKKERSESAKGNFAHLTAAQKVAEISSYFRDGQDLTAQGREFIMDGMLIKIW